MSITKKISGKSKKTGKGFPVWATVIIFVLAALILFLGSAAVYLLKFHTPDLVSIPQGPEWWRPENFRKSYHWSSVMAPGRSHTATNIDTVLHGQSGDPDALPTVKGPTNVPTRNERSVNFLFMGHDRVALNTDVIMLVNFNMDEGSLTILQIPRDTFYKTGRINTLMVSERAKARNADPSLRNNSSALLKKGMEGAVNELESSLGVVIDGYAIIDLKGFRQVIDLLGGVYMDVPFDMEYEDPEQGLYINLSAGPQILYGEQAEMFVRYRKGFAQGDIGRVNAQKIFLTALLAELKDVSAAQIPDLASLAIKHITTDVGLSDIVFYAKEFLGVDMSKVSMMTLPGYHTTASSGASYYVMNRAATLPLINGYFNVFNNDEITDKEFDIYRDFKTSARNFSAIYDASDIKAVVENAEAISNGEMVAPPV